MSYIYKTKGTCSTQIELDLDGDVVHNVKFTGGCNGNLKAIPKLVEGLTVAQVEEKIGGIKCGFKNTSCGDQLAKACRDLKPPYGQIAYEFYCCDRTACEIAEQKGIKLKTVQTQVLRARKMLQKKLGPKIVRP